MINKIKNKIKDKILTSEEKHMLKHVPHLERWGVEKFGKFTEKDVFVLGYPKSGNTLLQHLVAHLVYGLRKDTSKSLINTCVTEYYSNPYFFRLNKRHFFKNHELPKPEYKNVIYIIRDGRAAVRSLYYMQKDMGVKDISINSMYEDGGDSFRGTWNNHIKQWIDNPFNANIIYIKYEDLIDDKLTQIKKISDFLSLNRTEEELQNIVEATSLANMKNMENSYSWKRKKTFHSWNKKGSFVREGMASKYLSDELINPDALKKFEEISEEMLGKMNYM
jgi:hypothetical protein